MKKSKIAALAFTFLCSPIGYAKLTVTADNLYVKENFQVCADQWLKIIEDVGGNSEKATEFRVLMSIKCGNKIKNGMHFGQITPQNASDKLVNAVKILKEIYPRVSSLDKQQRVQEWIQRIKQRPEYPKETAHSAPAEAEAVR